MSCKFFTHDENLDILLFKIIWDREKEFDLALENLDLRQQPPAIKGFWAVTVSGNWRVIFRFEENSAVDIDYLDYH